MELINQIVEIKEKKSEEKILSAENKFELNKENTKAKKKESCNC